MTTEAPDLQTTTDTGALVKAAFERINAGEFEAARPLVERALSLAPRVGFVAHAKVHLDSDSGNHEEGTAWMREYLTREDPFEGINKHNAWHLAYMLVALGRFNEAMDWHERVVAPTVSAMTFNSTVQLLWRVFVRSGNKELPWEPLRRFALDLEKEEGIDRLGKATVFIATGDNENLSALLERLRAVDPAQEPAVAEAYIPTILGLRAFWQGDYAAARDQFARFDGDFGQISKFLDNKTPLEETYRAALERAG